VLPPVQADLLGFVDGTNQQPDANSKQLDVGQGHAYIARDDKTFVQNPVEDVN